MSNINEDILQLIQSSTGDTTYDFDPVKNDYIRLSLFDENGDFNRYFYSTNDFSLYDDDGDLLPHIVPSEVLDANDVPQGNYTLQFDFYRNTIDEIVNNYTVDDPVIDQEIVISDLIINLADELNYTLNTTEELCIDPTGGGSCIPFAECITGLQSIYGNTVNAVELCNIMEFDGNGVVGWGNLNFFLNGDGVGQTTFITGVNSSIIRNSTYVITEISPSRKEVRIIVKSNDDTFNQQQFDYDLFNKTFAEYLEDSFLSTPIGVSSTYEFHHVLNIARGRNILITNYTFDSTTDVNNTTLILRLHEPLPPDVIRFNEVQINRELVQQQKQDIFYVSNVTSFVISDALAADTESFSDIISEDLNDTYQDYNDLYESGSFSENVSDIISSSISNPDVNLNIDFSKFQNHVFFGSATSKLENFRTKVIKIENHLTEISRSLNPSTGSNSSTQVVEKRKGLFNKIQNIKTNFTPFEKFMYNDNQHTSTSSAPGIGINLTPSMPVTMSSDQANGAILSNFEGFKTVYKHTTQGATGNIQIFHNKYFAHKAPFFNFSGSVYLSFLMRANDELTSGGGAGRLSTSNNNPNNFDNITGVQLPHGAFHISRLLNPAADSGSYRRLAFVASQSWWRPTSEVNHDIGEINNWGAEGVSSNEYVVLSGSGIPTGSAADNNPIKSPSGYDTYPSMYSGSVINENISFNGACMPMGELFRIGWNNPNGAAGPITSSFITDIKVTLKNPTNALPFSHLYSTGSTEWTNWYDGMYASASAYDDDNIHSLQNNLPDNIRQDGDSGDLKTFLHMIGEHFDLLRNYIDNYTNFYKRNYKSKESVPSNLLPILANNLGWDVINPFSSSLSEYFSDNSNDNNVQEIGENTWRKTLNNIIYIYKSKGTLNSVRALLNIYGYPPDVLNVNEYGGSTEEHNPTIITSEPKQFIEGLKSSKGNISFESERKEFYTVNLKGTNKLNLDWWTNNANGDGIEFVFSSPNTTTNQTLVESSGSGGETMWDISLVTSASSATKGQLRFRLNNSLTGSLAIASNAVSMSTDFYDLKNTSLWNVMLQRMTGSLQSKMTQSYQLSLGLQDEDKINKFEIVSMSVIDPLTNVNFISGSSLDITSSTSVSGNLVFGESFSGSMSEIRNWSGSLSASKFKQHILNKFSVVGNDENMYKDRIWHFKLNENFNSGSNEKVFKDANPNYFKNYSISHSLKNDGRLYNKRIIDTFKFVPRLDVNNQNNNNKIIVDPEEDIIYNLSPRKRSEQNLYKTSYKKGVKRKNTTKIDLVKSPADPINKYITNNLADFDLTGKFGHPNSAKFSSSYKELDDLRDSLMDGVNVDVNTYIEGQSRIFNKSVLSGVQSILPRRATINSVGVSIKPDFLLRSKYKYHPVSIHTGSGAGVYEGTLLDYWTHIDASSTSSYIHNLSGSSLIRPNSASLDINSSYINFTQSALVLPYSSSIDYVSTYVNFTQSALVQPYSSSIDIDTDVISLSGSKLQLPHSSSIDYINTYVDLSKTIYDAPNDFIIYNIIDSVINLTGSKLRLPYSASIDYVNTYVNFTQSNYIAPYSTSIDINNSYFNFSSSKLQLPYSTSIDYVNTYVNFTQSVFDSPYSSSFNINDNYINFSSSKLQLPYSSSIDYVSTYINFSQSNYIAPYSSSININNDVISLSGSKLRLPHSSSIDYVNTYVNFTQSVFTAPYSTSIDIDTDVISLSGSELRLPHSSSIDYIQTYVNFTGSQIILPYSSSIENFVFGNGNGTGLDLQGKSYPKASDGTTRTRLIDTWGTSSNDTHFISFARGAEGVHGNYNTAYHDSIFLIHTIGDREELSGSTNRNTFEFDVDYTNENNHKGRLIVDQGLGYTYKTYVGSGSFAGPNGAPVDGRPMGRTAYFSASSDGTITYPANHFVNFPTSKEGIYNLTYGGSLCGIKITSIKKDGSGNLVTFIPDEQDPLYEVGGRQIHKLGWDSEFDQFVSASSHCVYVNKVGGSDTDNILKVVRRS